MASVDEKTKQSLLWQTVIPPAWEAIRFGFSIYIARILNPIDYGIMGIASVIIFYSNYLTELGFSNALIHRPDVTKKHISTVFTLNLGISVFLTLVVCLFSSAIADLFKQPELTNVLRVLSLVFIITSFSQISITMLRKELEYKKFTIISLFKSLLATLMTLFLAVQNFEYWSLIIGTVVGELFGSLLLFYSIKIKPRFAFHKESYKQLINYGLWNFVISQFFLMYTYAEKAIIGYFLGAKLVGIYDKAFSIAQMPVDGISMRINGVMFSSFNQYKKDPVELCRAFCNVTVFSSILCFPLLAGLCIVAHDFVDVAFGEKWLPMVYALQILSVASMFRVPLGLISSLNMAAGDYKVYIKSQMLIFGIAITLYFPAVKHGIETVSMIIAVTNFILLVASLGIAKRFIPDLSVREYLLALVPATINSSLMVITVYAAGQMPVVQTLPLIMQLLIKIIIGVIVYVVLFFSIRYRNTQQVRDKVLGLITRSAPV